MRAAIKRLAPDDGLSGNHIPAIVQDARGFMWFGLENGLNRYDGYEMMIDKHDVDDPTSLPNDGVNTLHVDSTDVLWAGTIRGLSRFDDASETFRSYWQTPGDLGDLSHQRIRSITEDSAGALWIGSMAASVSKLDPYYQQFTHYRHNPTVPRSLGGKKVRGSLRGQPRISMGGIGQRWA